MSQHLKVLKNAGIVTDQVDGTRRVYTVTPDGFEVLRQWLDVMWRETLDAFTTFANDPDSGAKS